MLDFLRCPMSPGGDGFGDETETDEVAHLGFHLAQGKGRVRKESAVAIFAETAVADIASREPIDDGTMGTAVALDFDNHGVGESDLRAGTEIGERKVEIDGEAFGHLVVDESDAAEGVGNGGFEARNGVVRVEGNESLSLHAEVARGDGRSGDTFFLRAAVFLVLDLDEGEI